MKALKIAIIVGGSINLALALFHIVLCRAIYVTGHGQAHYPLMQMLAVGGCVLIWFLALTSLIFREQLAVTSVGRSILLLNIAVYVSRVLGEIVLFPRPSLLIMILCAALAFLYRWIFFRALKISKENPAVALTE